MQLGLPFDDPAGRRAPLDPVAAGTAAPSGIQVYFVRHVRARQYLLRVDHDGRARVTIPRGGSRREAGAFASRHIAWIERQRARIARPALTAAERQAWRNRARLDLPARLSRLAADHGLTVPRVSIRNQGSRWGSCGRDGHICLNWRLMLMPAWVREYVILHELMHLRRMDHSPRYWKLVAEACPDFQAARQWLRDSGPTLR